MSKDIVIQLDGGIGVSFPNDPVNGRFRMRGTVVEGTKPMIGRKVEIRMTHAELEGAVNYGASALLRHPKCGTNPQTQEED
jgi:hypothetical protein